MNIQIACVACAKGARGNLSASGDFRITSLQNSNLTGISVAIGFCIDKNARAKQRSVFFARAFNEKRIFSGYADSSAVARGKGGRNNLSASKDTQFLRLHGNAPSLSAAIAGGQNPRANKNGVMENLVR